MPTQSATEHTVQSRLVAAIRAKIEESILKPGDRLPSRVELAREYGVSQMTVRGATSELAALGFVHSKSKSGVFVSDRWDRAAEAPRSAPGGALSGNIVAILGSVEPGAGEQHYRLEPVWALSIVVGLLDEARKHKLHTLTLSHGSLDPDSLSDLTSGAVAAVILPEVTNVSLIKECALRVAAAHVPLVVGGDHPWSSAFDRVVSDYEEGAYQLTRFLIGRGRKRIVQVWSQPADEYWFSRLRRGYERALDEAGLPSFPVIPLYTLGRKPESPDDFEKIRRLAAGSLISAFIDNPRPDAFMTNTDGVALPVARACRLAGFVPNEDIDIVGYDNYARYSSELELEPSEPIATIDKQNLVIGAEMLKMVLDRIRGRYEGEGRLLIVPPVLVTR